MTTGMRLSIAERWKPFSHQPGISMLLPLSTLGFKIYPSLICVYEMAGKSPQLIKEIALDIQGIVEEFTAQQDLEKGCLKVWGRARQGYFRYRIEALPSANLSPQIHPEGYRREAFTIIVEKNPAETPFFINYTPCANGDLPVKPMLENLSFGISKGQDWTLVDRRQQLTEILPFWFRLGQWMLLPETASDGGLHTPPTSGRFQVAEQALREKQPEELHKQLRMLYLTGFTGLLFPCAEDIHHHGLELPAFGEGESPLQLLLQGKSLIKRMLIDAKEDTVQILPCLPAAFHCGRMLDVQLPAVGKFNVEWSKKRIRRLSFQPANSGKLHFQFPSNVKHFRLRRVGDGACEIKTCGLPIPFSATDHYVFDNFDR